MTPSRITTALALMLTSAAAWAQIDPNPVTPIPEPGVLSLVALGVAGAVAVVRWNKRKK